MWEWFLSHLWEERVSDSYPIIYQPTDGGRIVKQQLKSQFLIVGFSFVLAQFHIKRAHFSLVFPTYFLFYTQIVVLFFCLFSSQLFIWTWKLGPDAHQQPVHRFPSHQQAINLDNQRKLRSTLKKVSILGSSSNNQATLISV